MQPDPQSSRNGSPTSSARHTSARAELDELRATCREQARDIAKLTETVSALTALAAADELRADEPRRHVGDAAVGPWQAQLALDTYAPAAARAVVTDVLAERVPASVLHDAVLLASELACNSVRHSGVGPPGPQVLRVRLRACWIIATSSLPTRWSIRMR